MQDVSMLSLVRIQILDHNAFLGDSPPTPKSSNFKILSKSLKIHVIEMPLIYRVALQPLSLDVDFCGWKEIQENPGNPGTPAINLCSEDENQQQTQPTASPGGNRTRVTYLS